MVQLLTLYTSILSATMHSVIETSRRHYGAISRSYCRRYDRL